MRIYRIEMAFYEDKKRYTTKIYPYDWLLGRNNFH